MDVVFWAVRLDKWSEQHEAWSKIIFGAEVILENLFSGKGVQVMFGQAVSVCAEADSNSRPVFVTADTQVVFGPVLQMTWSPSSQFPTVS